MEIWHDSVHGPIGWFDGASEEEFHAIMHSRPVRRLKQVSQLGFAAESYCMATHSRLAHSLGSMNVAIDLVAKLDPEQVENCLENYRDLTLTPTKNRRKEDKASWLKRHVGLSALLQDVGELPFEQSTKTYFELDGGHRQQVASWLGCDPNQLTGKIAFTLGCLNYLSEIVDSDRIDFICLARMIAPDLFRDQSESPLIKSVLDSAFDADRIDYVIRDGGPTIGSSIQASQVIASIEGYRNSQIIVNSPAPIAAVLLTRNVLYRSVYLDPKKRLHEAALRSLIATMEREPRKQKAAPPFGEISISEFFALTDQALLSWVQSVYTDNQQPSTVRNLAGTVLGYEEQKYETVWLSKNDDCQDIAKLEGLGVLAAPSVEAQRALDVPAQLFAINSRDPRATLNDIIPELFAAEVDEQKDAILAYIPMQSSPNVRKRLEAGASDGSLYNALSGMLAEQSFGCTSDTRHAAGFEGPPIHIVWCWDDIAYTRRIVRSLYRKRQQYRLLLSDFDGLGTTPRNNSVNLIREATIVLVIASHSYVGRWKNRPNGNLAAELLEIRSRVGKIDQPTVLPVSVDPWDEIAEEFPWAAIGFDASAPFIGKPLSHCTARDVEMLVDKLIELAKGSFK